MYIRTSHSTGRCPSPCERIVVQKDLVQSNMTDPERQQMDRGTIWVAFGITTYAYRLCSVLPAVLGSQASTALGTMRRTRACPSMYRRLCTAYAEVVVFYFLLPPVPVSSLTHSDYCSLSTGLCRRPRNDSESDARE